MICEDCGRDYEVGDWPFCPHGTPTYGFFGDEIVGGQVIENLGHEPVTVYSKSELRREAAKRGLEPMTRHVPPDAGSDKAPHTQRFV